MLSLNHGLEGFSIRFLNRKYLLIKNIFFVYTKYKKYVILLEKGRRKRMDTKIIVKLPDDLKSDVKKKAKSLGLSLSAYVRFVLMQNVKEK